MAGLKVIEVAEPDSLLSCLIRSLPHCTRHEIKSFLKFGAVSVDGESVTRHDHPLGRGDQVIVQTDRKPATRKDFLKRRLGILHEDAALVVMTKRPGLLTVATAKERARTAYHELSAYLALDPSGKAPRGRRPKELFVVHRLDREASGLLLFARTHQAKLALQKNWERFEKRYYAVVEKAPQPAEGKIESYLAENKFLNVYTTRNPAEGKFSVTHYRTLRKSEEYALLEVRLETGRKHQIRVHLSGLGHPITGDDRYGAKKNALGRLALHAFFLSFTHPANGRTMNFQTGVPPAFRKLVS
jgi:23S rRNA pseudouridine1911/1915/1917 synthase